MFDLLNRVLERVQNVLRVQMVPWRFLDGDKKVYSLKNCFERFEPFERFERSFEPFERFER